MLAVIVTLHFSIVHLHNSNVVLICTQLPCRCLLRSIVNLLKGQQFFASVPPPAARKETVLMALQCCYYFLHVSHPIPDWEAVHPNQFHSRQGKPVNDKMISQ